MDQTSVEKAAIGVPYRNLLVTMMMATNCNGTVFTIPKYLSTLPRHADCDQLGLGIGSGASMVGRYPGSWDSTGPSTEVPRNWLWQH